MGEAEKLALKEGFFGVEFGGRWKGMDTWYPITTEDPLQRAPCIGLPMFIIDDDGVIRWSTPKEAKERLFD